MYDLIKDIVNYLKFLNSECKLHVTVHFNPERVKWFPKEAFEMLLPFNVHQNPYCVAMKKRCWDKCIQSQRKVELKQTDERWFCGNCYAGVYEYVYLIRDAENVVGFISVSGYRNADGEERSRDKQRWMEYLSPQAIPLKECERIIPPLARMFELLFIYPKEDGESDCYNQIVQFINERNGQTSLDDICECFCRSKSYISHLFKCKSQKTLRAYCNDLKLEYAKRLLITTSIPITDVALDVGFNDVSYFIALFREHYHVTPLKMRKQMEQKKMNCIEAVEERV